MTRSLNGLSAHTLESGVETDGYMNTFGEAVGGVHLLMTWKLCEVEVVSGYRIRSLM